MIKLKWRHLAFTGYSVSFPQNEMLQYYEEILEVDGFKINQNLFKLKNKFDLSLSHPSIPDYTHYPSTPTTYTLTHHPTSHHTLPPSLKPPLIIPSTHVTNPTSHTC